MSGPLVELLQGREALWQGQYTVSTAFTILLGYIDARYLHITP